MTNNVGHQRIAIRRAGSTSNFAAISLGTEGKLPRATRRRRERSSAAGALQWPTAASDGQPAR